MPKKVDTGELMRGLRERIAREGHEMEQFSVDDLRDAIAHPSARSPRPDTPRRT